MLKNVPAEGRTRRVLQDIGNMVAERAVEVKLQAQPIARSLSLSLSLTHTHTLTHTSPCSRASMCNSCLAGLFVQN